MKCQYHQRANAIAICSVCSRPLCKRCAIEDMGRTYCDNCYANEDGDSEPQLVAAEHELENEDYVDVEMMDLLDTEDDDGLF